MSCTCSVLILLVFQIFIHSSSDKAAFENFIKTLISSADDFSIEVIIVDANNSSILDWLNVPLDLQSDKLSSVYHEIDFHPEYFSTVLFLILIPNVDSEPIFTEVLCKVSSIVRLPEQYKSLRPIYLFLDLNTNLDRTQIFTSKEMHLTITNFSIASNVFLLGSLNGSLTEIYSIRNLQVIQDIPVNLTDLNDMLKKLRFKTERRSDFHQGEIIAIGMDDPDYPLATKFNRNLNNSNLELESGFEVETLHYFRDGLNFREIAIRGSGYVRQGSNGSLTGMASQINAGEGDIAIGAAEFLEYRVSGSDGITYIHPIFHAKISAYFKQPPASSVRNIYTQTFELTLWIGIGVLWLLIICMVRMFIRVQEKLQVIIDDDIVFVDELFVFIIAAICQQGWHRSTFSTAIKIVFFFSVLFGLLSYIAYSAALVSVLSVEVVPIQSFNDLISKGFHITSDLHIPTAKVVVKDLEERQIIPTLEEDARNIEINDNLDKLVTAKLAIITISDSFYPILQGRNYSEEYVCNTISFKTVSQRPLKSSCFVKRGSPLREYFNYRLLTMQERGIKHRLIQHYVLGTSIQCLQVESAFQDNLGLRDLFTPFALILGANALSLILLPTEIWAWRLKKKKGLKNKY